MSQAQVILEEREALDRYCATLDHKLIEVRHLAAHNRIRQECRCGLIIIETLFGEREK